MITFKFSRRDKEPAHGFDLGDIEVTGTDGLATSAGRIPDQGSMIYLSIVGLLDIASGLLGTGTSRAAFVAPDSSFQLRLSTNKKGRVRVSCGKTHVGETQAIDFARAVLSGVEAFLSEPGNQLSVADAVHNDLTASLAGLRGALKRK